MKMKICFSAFVLFFTHVLCAQTPAAYFDYDSVAAKSSKSLLLQNKLEQFAKRLEDSVTIFFNNYSAALMNLSTDKLMTEEAKIRTENQLNAMNEDIQAVQNRTIDLYNKARQQADTEFKNYIEKQAAEFCKINRFRFFTEKKALISGNGYSDCTNEFLTYLENQIQE